MRVSVITPTSGSRASCHHSLYERFIRQTYADKTLLVCDDAHTPSPFFSSLHDARVQYFHERTQLTIGEKRQRLVSCADGDIVVQFDDDDYYAPAYIATMVSHLRDADLVKLTGWFIFDTSHGALFYWDTRRLNSFHCRVGQGRAPTWLNIGREVPSVIEEWRERQLWGYGFSFVFRRTVCQKSQFARYLNHSEDYDFCVAVRESGGRVKGVVDKTGLALHIIHGTNNSVFPNFALPPLMLRHFFGRDALRYLRGVYGSAPCLCDARVSAELSAKRGSRAK
jgi:glycosyltransferase involved in cell wall biosynthesis